jgi:predicted GNAT superfamily acetyltransferase
MTKASQRSAAVAPNGRFRPLDSAAVSIDMAQSMRDARDVAELLTRIWPLPQQQAPITAELVGALVRTGNYVGIARKEGPPVGAAVAFRAADELGAYVHSHIAGVLPQWQGASIGFALKQHQRLWAMNAGLDRITWTFDPLVARNAYFNVMKLGARLTAYHVDHYGPMSDGINAGDETDRCLVTWSLSGARAVAAATGTLPPVDLAGLRLTGAQETLTADPAGAPLIAERASPTRLVQLPRDIVGMRAANATLAHAWRRALRAVLVPAFADGLEIVGVTRGSWYVVGRAEQ